LCGSYAAIVLAVSLLVCFEDSGASTDTDVLNVAVESGGGVRAVARVTFSAPPRIVHSLLTDYVHWPELFEVRMRLAELSIHEGVATTDFRIEHAFLPGERRLITRSHALPGLGMVTDLVGGDFKQYHRVWKLTPVDGGSRTRADFELVVAVDSIVPDWLVALAMRRELEAHFRIVKEKSLARAQAEK
jgi:hypothetical protein